MHIHGVVEAQSRHKRTQPQEDKEQLWALTQAVGLTGLVSFPDMKQQVVEKLSVGNSM